MRRGLQNLRSRDHDHLYDIVYVEGRALTVAAAFSPRRAPLFTAAPADSILPFRHRTGLGPNLQR